MSRRVLVLPLLTVAVLVAMVAFAQPDPVAFGEDGGAEFVSQRGCKKCHFKQHRSWKKTVHAKALDSLKPGERAEAKTKAGLDPAKDYTKDAGCLECHVTGYGQPGGYPALKDAWSEDEQKLAKNNTGVGCESCHGAGSIYAPYKKDNEEYKRAEIAGMGLMTPVTAANCTNCHNEKSPTFDAEAGFDFEERKAAEGAVHDHTDLKFPH